MTHYICTGGCGGESDTPGTCHAHNCPKFGLPLTPCSCADGKHTQILEPANSRKTN